VDLIFSSARIPTSPSRSQHVLYFFFFFPPPPNSFPPPPFITSDISFPVVVVSSSLFSPLFLTEEPLSLFSLLLFIWSDTDTRILGFGNLPLIQAVDLLPQPRTQVPPCIFPHGPPERRKTRTQFFFAVMVNPCILTFPFSCMQRILNVA